MAEMYDIQQLRNDTDFKMSRSTPVQDPGIQMSRTIPLHGPDLYLTKTNFLVSDQNGFRVNLLANSLRAKLKQQRLQARRDPHGQHGAARSSDTLANNTDLANLQQDELPRTSMFREQISRSTVTTSRQGTSSLTVSDHLTRSRLNSGIFSSGQSHDTSTPMIRTVEVEPDPGSTPQQTDFAGRGHVNCDIMFVKRAGIFQPVNKYETGSHALKVVDSLNRSHVCDYVTYILAEDGQRLVKRDRPKQKMVSWRPRREEDGAPAALPLKDEMSLRHEDHRLPKVTREDYAFRRPIFVPGQSKISSVGVRWSVRTEPQRNDEKKQAPRKPTWSWLVTSSGDRQRHAESGDLNQLSQSQTSPEHRGSDLRTRTSKDLHPVSTALDRLGITASRVKWTVPSTGQGHVDVQQTVMERLELVKRPGSLLYQ